MAYTVFQSGTHLYGMDPRGSIVQLAVPDGVTIDATVPARFAIFNKYVVLVNSVNRPLTIDANLNVRVLCPLAPTSQPTASGVSAGSLSGTFKIRQTFIVKDAFGNLIAESDFGPESDSVTVASKLLRATNLNLSEDQVSGSRLYRTTTGTAVFFKWMELDGNTQTSIEDDLSDAGLATFSAPALGTPPDLTLISEYKGRLFGIARTDPDNLRYTEVGAMYAWPEDNIQPIPQAGSDDFGCTGFMRRRDALGIGRMNGLYQFTGTSDSTFRFTAISEDAGIVSADSVAVYKNTAFFAWLDGIYTWDESGVTCISDDKVRKWFTRDSTFNLSRLKDSFGVIDPIRKKYRLYLASAGSQVIDCWIEYDFLTGKFWGPHTTHAFNPSAAFRFAAASGQRLPMVGGTDGYCRLDRKRRTDDVDTPIDFDVVTSRNDMGLPRQTKYFGELSVLVEPQERGTLLVQSVAGDANVLRTADIEPEQVPLTESTHRLSRVGTGTAAKVRFRSKEAGVTTIVRGYEIDPVRVIGKR